MGSGCISDGTLSAHNGGPSGTGFAANFYNRGGSVSNILITNAGRAYSSVPTITCCRQVYDVTITGTGTTYTNNGALIVSCTGACTGAGLAGTCTALAGSVTSVVITERGYGYTAANPPVLTCPGDTAQTFTPVIDTSTGGEGCLGVRLLAVMQFTKSGSTWADREDRYVGVCVCVSRSRLVNGAWKLVKIGVCCLCEHE
jgi:hypothetical protein